MIDEIISSKDICKLIISVLKLEDKRLMDHGRRVAYILYRMLCVKGEHEDFEMADLAFLGVLHDIGAFKVAMGKEMLEFELSDPMPHSVYGFFFMKYLSPFQDKARILMYNHVDYQQLLKVDFEEKNISNYLNAAERFDIFQKSMGKKFDVKNLRKYEGSKYAKETLDILEAAMDRYNIRAKFESGEFENELDELFEGILFSDKERERYIEMLMYISGFRDEYNVINTVTAGYVAREIALRLGGIDSDQLAMLHFGCLIHDVGMLIVPQEIINAPRALMPEEMIILRKHVESLEIVMKDRLNSKVLSIAMAHHERLDGSGYPYGLRDEDMNILQKILMVADTVTGLTCDRPYRPPKSKEKVIAILTDEVKKNKFSKDVVSAFIEHYDEIMKVVKERTEDVLKTWRGMQQQYEMVAGRLAKGFSR